MARPRAAAACSWAAESAGAAAWGTRGTRRRDRRPPPPPRSDGHQAGRCWHRRPAKRGQARSRRGWGGLDRRPRRCRRQSGPHSALGGWNRGGWPGRRPHPTATCCPRPDVRAERARRARPQQVSPPAPFPTRDGRSGAAGCFLQHLGCPASTGGQATPPPLRTRTPPPLPTF